MIAALFAIWGLVKGAAGPWVFLGAVVLFAVVTVAIALVRAVRLTIAAEQRTAVMSETARIPEEEKGFLDFGAGIEEALAEQNIIGFLAEAKMGDYDHLLRTVMRTMTTR
jgi:hypothetical protein